jgi:hypothetical protein
LDAKAITRGRTAHLGGVSFHPVALCGLGGGRGIEQADEYWVRRAWRGLKLRLVQRANEKWVVDTFDGTGLTGCVGR